MVIVTNLYRDTASTRNGSKSGFEDLRADAGEKTSNANAVVALFAFLANQMPTTTMAPLHEIPHCCYQTNGNNTEDATRAVRPVLSARQPSAKVGPAGSSVLRTAMAIMLRVTGLQRLRVRLAGSVFFRL